MSGRTHRQGRDGGRVLDARPPRTRNQAGDVPDRHIDDIPINWESVADAMGSTSNWNDGREDA